MNTFVDMVEVIIYKNKKQVFHQKKKKTKKKTRKKMDFMQQNLGQN
jgi:hypothetical protein